ncbi:putative protein phosphatase 2C 60 [Drosera capensis]
MSFLSVCLWATSDASQGRGGSDSSGSGSGGRRDGLLWYKDIGQHVYGDFSMTMMQANNIIEDQCQIESGILSSLGSGPFGTFVGVYDGHGGADTSCHINYNLFNHLKINVRGCDQKSSSSDRGGVSLSVVSKQWPLKPQIASVGSCCLVGVVCDGPLYVANLGDSRAVLGKLMRGTGGIQPVQLSTEHNASLESERRELQSMHPDDPQIALLRQNITRSIGEFYLKRPEYNREPLNAKFLLPESFRRPILSLEPSIVVHELQSQDQFIIFASDGLWEHLSNQEAVDIVHSISHDGSARKLVKAALQGAAKNREMRYSDLKKILRGVWRHFHDDITVIVLFLDSNLVSRATTATGPQVSLKGGAMSLASNSRTSVQNGSWCHHCNRTPSILERWCNEPGIKFTNLGTEWLLVPPLQQDPKYP